MKRLFFIVLISLLSIAAVWSALNLQQKSAGRNEHRTSGHLARISKHLHQGWSHRAAATAGTFIKLQGTGSKGRHCSPQYITQIDGLPYILQELRFSW